MPTFSFTEKEWDKVRPSSVKKTGVSEAMRDVLKKVPKDLKALKAPKECDEAGELLSALLKAFENAEGQVKKAKDDKNGAAGKLKTWTSEAEEGRRMLELHKNKLLYADVNQGAEEKFNGILENVERTIKDAAQAATEILKDLKANKAVNVDGYSKDQQNYRNVLRDAKDAVTKKGFIKLVKFINDFHLTGLDPAKIEVPAATKKIEGRLTVLEQAVDALGDAMAQAVENQGTVAGTGQLADEARDLLDEFKDSYRKIKALATKGKQLQSSSKQALTALRSSQLTETNKLIAIVEKVHDIAQQYEDAVLKEGYRSRNTKQGELHLKYAALSKKQGFDETLNKPFRDWRATLFDAIRLCTMPISAVKKDVDEGVEFLIEIGGTTASQAETLAKRVDKERREIASKYGSAVA